MIKNYLKVGLRNLMKYKFYSFINVTGLAIGISCCLLITLYIVDELSYDRHHIKADRIYRVQYKSDFGGRVLSSPPMAEAMMNDYPEIESVVRLFNYNQGESLIRVQGKQRIKEDKIVFSDPTLFDVFTIPFIAGNQQTALGEPNTIVISEQAAKRHFGENEALGKTLIFDDEQVYKVTGVFEDMPSTSHFHFDFIASLVGKPISEDTRWLRNIFYTYILFKEGAEVQGFEEKIVQMMEKYAGPQIMSALSLSKEQLLASGRLEGFYLLPLKKIHLYSHLAFEHEVNGDIKYVYIFSIIAVFILFIGFINFTNLSTARSASRAKEVGVRKVMGSYRSHLIKQFLSESILMTCIAFFLSLYLAHVLIPFLNNISGKSLSIPFSSLTFWIISVITIFTIGSVAGIYPAFILSAFKPISALKGAISTRNKKSTLRNSLVVFQFAISLFLIICTISIFKQLQYIQDKKLGFDKEQVIIVKDAYALGNQLQSFKEKASTISSISSITISSYLPVTSTQRSDTGFWPEGERTEENIVAMQYWRVDHDYIKTLGMEIVEGRNFSLDYPSDSSALIINEQAAKEFGFENPIGQRINSFMRGRNVTEGEHPVFTIVGVVKDFYFQSMKENVAPMSMILDKSEGCLSFKTNSKDLAQTIDLLEKQWKEIDANQPFKYSFLDTEFDAMYHSEVSIGKLFSAFALLAIFIACIGLFGLASFTTEQRVKEIGIRKVLGASVKSIVLLLSKEFTLLIAVAFVMASPLAWWGVDKWLENYAYKTDLGVDIYILSGLSVFILAWLTISYQSVKAALHNPTKALRMD